MFLVAGSPRMGAARVRAFGGFTRLFLAGQPVLGLLRTVWKAEVGKSPTRRSFLEFVRVKVVLTFVLRYYSRRGILGVPLLQNTSGQIGNRVPNYPTRKEVSWNRVKV